MTCGVARFLDINCGVMGCCSALSAHFFAERLGRTASHDEGVFASQQALLSEELRVNPPEV